MFCKPDRKPVSEQHLQPTLYFSNLSDNNLV